MEDFFESIIEAFSWFTIFLSPFIPAFIIAVVIYFNNTELSMLLPTIIMLIGASLGILLAERIRKKYGCSDYIGSIRSGEQPPLKNTGYKQDE